MAAAATDVVAVAALSAEDAVLARGDPSPPYAGLIVAICPTQRQCLCLRYIFLRLGRLEGGSPWRHGRQWPQAASPRKRLAKHPFISEAPDTCLSVPLFCTYLFLSSSLRKMSKNAEQALTSVAVMMAVRRPSWCIAVFSWSFVSILCYFVYLDVRARIVCVYVRKYVLKLRIKGDF